MLRPLPALLLATLLLAWAEPAGARDDAGQYRRIPWHLIDIVWTMGPETVIRPVRELSAAVTIEQDPGDEVPVYIAPIGMMHLDGIPAYAGLMTNMNRPGKGNAGRGIIFSRWGERRTDYIRPESDGYLDSSGHEGDFIGVRRPLAWSKGTYEAKLKVNRATGSDAPSWIRYEVCLVRVECTTGGELGYGLPPERLARQVTSFLEIHTKPIKPEEIPRFAIVFHPPMVNGARVRLEGILAKYPVNVPFVARASMQKDGSIRVVTGPIRNPAELPVSGNFRTESFSPPP
jgi:hypothetical protein